MGWFMLLLWSIIRVMYSMIFRMTPAQLPTATLSQKTTSSGTSMHSIAKNALYKTIGAGIFITFLVLPSVTTVIFESFLCTRVEDDYYLIQDMTISCSSDYYWKVILPYAICMVILYPIGVLMTYCYLLYTCKDFIQTREDVQYNLADDDRTFYEFTSVGFEESKKKKTS